MSLKAYLQQKHRPVNWAGLGVLATLSIAALPAIAQPTSVLNPCPGIYYEPPFDSTRAVSQDCPPNTATLRQQAAPAVPLPQPEVAPPASSANPIQPLLPGEVSDPIANITPLNGTANVRLRNDTNTNINYQAIGYTETRTLASGEEVVLRDLPLPVTVTLVRPDNGSLQITPLASTTPDSLSLSSSEAPGVGEVQGALNIQQDGQVFLN
jgi:hypothetical protein